MATSSLLWEDREGERASFQQDTPQKTQGSLLKTKALLDLGLSVRCPLGTLTETDQGTEGDLTKA